MGRLGKHDVDELRLAAHFLKAISHADEDAIGEMADRIEAFGETPEGQALVSSGFRILAEQNAKVAFLHAFALGYALRMAEAEMYEVAAGDSTCIEHHRRNCPACCEGQGKVTLHPTD